MFDRYSMLARQAIFFARMEAGRLGATGIAPEHLLLGVAHADFNALQHLGGNRLKEETFTAPLLAMAGTAPPLPDSADMPLTPEAQQVLADTQQEADTMGHKEIRAAHLVLGLLRAEGDPAQRLLIHNGIVLETAREVVRKMPPEPMLPANHSFSPAVFEMIKRKQLEARQNPATDPSADPELPSK